MTQQQVPQWYTAGDIPESVRQATAYDEITTEIIVDVLATHELDAPRNRIESLVEKTRDQLDAEPTTSQPAAGEEEDSAQRALRPRLVAAEDFAYLGPRDFARILGGVLSRYEGGFQLPDEAHECAADLFWFRAQTTVALRTVSRSPGTPVEDAVIRDVAGGHTDPASGRPASTVAVVSNTNFTDDAREVAEANDIVLVGTETLEQWLRDVHLTYGVLGDLLELRDLTDEEQQAILDDLPALPTPIQDDEPFDRQPPTITRPLSSLDRDLDEDPDTERTDSDDSAQSADADDDDDGSNAGGSSGALDSAPEEAGQHGVLYADPDKDGDIDAFDRFEDELMEDSE